MAVGAPDLEHSIHANLGWFVGSHPVGAAELGKELIGGAAMTLLGAAAFTADHPDISGWKCLTVPGVSADGAYSARTAAVIAETTVFSVWVDVVIHAVTGYSTVFCIPNANSGWGSPYAVLSFGRNGTTSTMTVRHTIGASTTNLNTGAANTFLTSGRHRFWFTKNGTVGKFGVDGAQVGANIAVAAGASASYWAGNGNAIILGNRSPYSAGEGLQAEFLRAMFWTREVSVDEMASLNTDPQLGLLMATGPTITVSLDAAVQKEAVTAAASLDASIVPVRLVIPPNEFLALTNLTGNIADIDDDPVSPDGSWLTASSPTAGVDLRVNFVLP